MSLKIPLTRPVRGQSPSSEGHQGVEEQVSPIAPRTPLIFIRRTGMEEQASCPTKDPTRLALQGQGLTVDPSCQSRCGLSKKQEGHRNHTILERIGNTPYNQPGLGADDQKHHIGAKEITPNRHPRWNPNWHTSARVKLRGRKK